MLSESTCVQVTFLFGATSEFDQGKNVIDISKEVGVKFLVFR